MNRPIKQMVVTSAYGVRVHPVEGELKFHSGTDYRAREGTPLYAIIDGEVVISKYSSTAGNYVVIDHGNIQLRYAHLRELTLKVGTKVIAGQLIGYSGCTGRITGPHLHLEVRVGKYDAARFFDKSSDGNYKNAIDPELFFREVNNLEETTFEQIIKKCSSSPDKWNDHFKMLEMLSSYYDDLVVKAYQQGYKDALMIVN